MNPLEGLKKSYQTYKEMTERTQQDFAKLPRGQSIMEALDRIAGVSEIPGVDLIVPAVGMTKSEAQIIRSMHPAFKKSLAKIIAQIKEIYPEVEQIGLVGSAARRQMDAKLFGSKIKKSDIDILMSFPKGSDLFKVGLKDAPLWSRWSMYKGGDYNPLTREYVPFTSGNPWERTIDFLKTTLGGHSHTGEHLDRLRQGLETPEIVLWKRR